MKNKDELMSLIHTPAMMGQRTMLFAQNRRKLVESGRGVRFPATLDDSWEELNETTGKMEPQRNFLPMFPGDLAAVLGRPGNAKSLLVGDMSREEAVRIARSAEKDKECVIYIPYEGSTELIDAAITSGKKTFTTKSMVWGYADEEQVAKVAIQRPKLPLYYIGRSQSQAGQPISPMYIDTVYDSIELINREFGVKPRLATIDYIQLIPDEKTRDKTAQVSAAVQRAKELAIALGIPILMAAQAGRQVDERVYKIPGMADFQHASAIEQILDKALSTWIPSRYYSPQDEDWATIEVGGVSVRNRGDLLIVKKLKERYNTGYGVWPLRIDYSDYSIHPWDGG